MRKLLLALLLAATQAHAAYAPSTTGLYNVEQNLSDTAGSSHGTLVDALTYQATGAWAGSYCAGNGSFTVPTSVVASSGTLEFSFRTAAAPTNSRPLYSIQTSGATRAQEIYYFGGNFYAYSNSTGVNSAFFAVAGNKNYYIKDTWNGTSRNIWAGEWTVAGTVTLTNLTNVASADMSSPTGVRLLRSTADPASDGFIDWVRFRSVYDNTATVTTDPTSSGVVVPKSVYPWQWLRPHISPQKPWYQPMGWLFWPFFATSAKAGILDWRYEQAVATKAWTEEKVKLLSVAIAKGQITVTPTVTPVAKALGTQTATPTPTATPTEIQAKTP